MCAVHQTLLLLRDMYCTHVGETAILPQELKAVADRESDGRVTLIAIDAHW
jgi:hypothetical protein